MVLNDGAADRMQEANARMRKASGEVDNADPLVAFLYVLARDHITPGKLEGMLEALRPAPLYQFTNGWLARWAEDAAARLRAQEGE